MTTSMRHMALVCGHQIRRLLFRRSSVLWSAALGLAIVGILGMSLQGFMSPGFSPDRPYKVALVQEKPWDMVSAALTSRPDFFELLPMSDPEEAREAVLGREADAAVIVPAEFPDRSARIVAAPGSIAAGLLDEALRTAATGIEEPRTETVRVHRIPLAAAAMPANAPDAQVPDPGESLPKWLQTDSFGYYAVAITVMFAMFSIHGAIVMSARERATDTYVRLRAVGVTSGAYMTAAAVSGVAVGIAFTATMALATRLLFGVHWGSLGATAFLALVGAAATAGLSLLVMALVPGADHFEQAGSALFNVLAFLGGSLMPLHVLPPWFRTALGWLPNRYMLDGFLKLAQGADGAAVRSELAALILSAAGLFATATLLLALRAKREVL